MESFYGDPTTQNTSGQGSNALIPPEIQKWNWGAFFLSWIWGIGNRVWLSLLCFIPFVGLIMAFVLGFKGNEWAWQSKQWQSIEHFQSVQRKWAKWGVIFFVVILIIGILLGLTLFLFMTFVLPGLVSSFAEFEWLFNLLEAVGLIEIERNPSPISNPNSTIPDMTPPTNDPNFY